MFWIEAIGSRLRRWQVRMMLGRIIRVFDPCSVRVPPLILRAITSGRTERSAKLFSGMT